MTGHTAGHMAPGTGILVAGAGPAGMAAAVRAAESGKQVTVVDDNPAEGGQIWRGGKRQASNSQAAAWFKRLKDSGAKILSGCRIVGGDARARTLLVETTDSALHLPYAELILATGARELFLPFPGWTLPNVMGVGGLQALVKAGLPVNAKRIVVAGTGPLLLAVASGLRKQGANVVAIAEQADWNRLLRFGLSLATFPEKLWQAGALKASLGSTPYLPGSWVTSAEGEEKLRRVEIRTASGTKTFDCDYLAVAYGFSPNTELAQLLGCAMQGGFVSVDSLQRTTIPGIYCAGEVTGLGGVDLSLIEGEIAGFAASGRDHLARKLFPVRERARKFAHSLNRAFALPDELRSLPDATTIVCRCEDVPLEKLRAADSWRMAKLHLRCGMGPCQGRVCGPAVEFLFGWKPESVRPPVFPARIATLISESTYTIEKGVNQ